MNKSTYCGAPGKPACQNINGFQNVLGMGSESIPNLVVVNPSGQGLAGMNGCQNNMGTWVCISISIIILCCLLFYFYNANKVHY